MQLAAQFCRLFPEFVPNCITIETESALEGNKSSRKLIPFVERLSDLGEPFHLLGVDRLPEVCHTGQIVQHEC
jgi:hypothetical protein